MVFCTFNPPNNHTPKTLPSNLQIVKSVIQLRVQTIQCAYNSSWAHYFFAIPLYLQTMFFSLQTICSHRSSFDAIWYMSGLIYLRTQNYSYSADQLVSFETIASMCKSQSLWLCLFSLQTIQTAGIQSKDYSV